MMHAMDSARLLFTRIVSALKAGGNLTGEILDFIDTSFSLPESDRLAAFLNNGEDCERDTLLDLIFFPDHTIQMDLEPLLESGRFTLDDERTILDRLLAHAIEAPIRMPDGRELTCIRLPDFIKQRYLERLNIAWQADPGLTAAIDTAVADPLRTIVKVRLRNTGCRFADQQNCFLVRFFERMDDTHIDYLACLDLLLALMDKTNATLEVYNLLADHKRTCFRSLQQARRFETLLRRSNMETLMLQGILPPQESQEQLLGRMALIDRISLGVYGRTEIMELPREAPLREVADLDTPAALFQSLLS